VSQALVSVVIPVYNGISYLEKTVVSILSQNYKNIEVILVDDGSRDKSKDLIQKLADSDDRIKAFYNENGGVAFARNFAISKARGEYIAFCDQDDLWLESKLSKQIPLFNNSQVGLVYSGAIADYVLTGKQSKPNFLKKYRGRVFENIAQLNMFTCCTAVVRKSDLKKVGGFDTDRSLMGVDDWHLWLKLSLVCEFDFVPEYLAIHVFHGDNYSSNDQKMHEAEIVCLDKIEKIAQLHHVSANWPKIKQQVHVRYAKSYIYSGMYRLAGDTFLRAHNSLNAPLLFLKGMMFKYVPLNIWRLLQNFKRSLYSRNSKPS
jgi:glycosyltransferase involved in cell wall biosynthesis